jgi:hypothetical protein
VHRWPAPGGLAGTTTDYELTTPFSPFGVILLCQDHPVTRRPGRYTEIAPLSIDLPGDMHAEDEAMVADPQNTGREAPECDDAGCVHPPPE